MADKIEQVMDIIKSDIEHGIFKKGERIPSINETSEEFYLSRDTVEKAQEPQHFGAPFGWPGGANWLSSSTFYGRVNFADGFFFGRQRPQLLAHKRRQTERVDDAPQQIGDILAVRLLAPEILEHAVDGSDGRDRVELPHRGDQVPLVPGSRRGRSWG